MMKLGIFFLIIVMNIVAHPVCAQDVAVKTNILSDVFLNINTSLEVGLAPRWTLDISGEVNAWTLSHDRRWKHWAVQPEARYWFCDLHGGQYNIGGIDTDFSLLGTDFSTLKSTRYQGWFVGAGVAYGYAWILGRHWNIETEIGVGYSYTRYDRFRCAGCGKKVSENKPHNYFGPTKVAVNLVYLF